jgi:hypothetical protein
MKLIITEAQYKSLTESDDFDYEGKIWELLRSGQIENVKLAFDMAEGMDLSIVDELKSAGFEAFSRFLKTNDFYELITKALLTDFVNIHFYKEDLIKAGGKVPRALLYLKPFEHLRISGAGIREVPEFIGELTFLENLDLSNNLLSDLPDSFANLSKLKELNLAENTFYGIPEVLYSMKSLKWLDFYNNQLHSANEVIYLNDLEHSGSLVELSLAGNGFSPEDKQQINSAFTKVNIIWDEYN